MTSILWFGRNRQVTSGHVSEFFRPFTVMHRTRWHAQHKTAGTGQGYQGRFKAFPRRSETHVLTGMRYVERNPLRANLIASAEE